jgi:hypothetical protein
MSHPTTCQEEQIIEKIPGIFGKIKERFEFNNANFCPDWCQAAGKLHFFAEKNASLIL